MLKHVFGKKLSRDTDSRKALFRSLTKALVENGKLTTTKAKAKAIQGSVDKIMGDVKENSVAARRRVLGNLANDRKTTDKLFKDYIKFTEKRNSGFTRIINLPRRRGDNAEIARIEWVDSFEKEKAVTKTK